MIDKNSDSQPGPYCTSVTFLWTHRCSKVSLFVWLTKKESLFWCCRGVDSLLTLFLPLHTFSNWKNSAQPFLFSSPHLPNVSCQYLHSPTIHLTFFPSIYPLLPYNPPSFFPLSITLPFHLHFALGHFFVLFFTRLSAVIILINLRLPWFLCLDAGL